MAPLLSTTLTLLLDTIAIDSNGALAQAPKPPASFKGNPAVGSVVKDWKYMDCSTEVAGRALTGLSYSDDGMTIDSCQAFCTKNNYPLAGVEYARRHENDEEGEGAGGKRDHGEEHDHDDYHDYGHGPVNVDVAARKGRFIKVVRRSPDAQRQVEREERVSL